MRDVTNAERIRGMSDEELVRLIMCWCPPEMDWNCAKGFNGCDGCEECWALEPGDAGKAAGAGG